MAENPRYELIDVRQEERSLWLNAVFYTADGFAHYNAGGYRLVHTANPDQSPELPPERLCSADTKAAIDAGKLDDVVHAECLRILAQVAERNPRRAGRPLTVEKHCEAEATVQAHVALDEETHVLQGWKPDVDSVTLSTLVFGTTYDGTNATPTPCDPHPVAVAARAFNTAAQANDAAALAQAGTALAGLFPAQAETLQTRAAELTATISPPTTAPADQVVLDQAR